MNTTVVKRFTFEAAHDLPNHAGKCRGLHGHTYTVEVGVNGEVKEQNGDSDEGMVLDFGEISKVFRERIFSVCDHHYLNDALPVEPTSAENIAAWAMREMVAGLLVVAPHVVVRFVRVWETQTGYAEVAAR